MLSGMEEIDRLADEFVSAQRAPGMAYGIVRDGRLVHTGGAGVVAMGGAAPDSDSVFRIASMTKSFTAAAALLLRDEGALQLDEHVATYVPAVAEMPVPRVDAPALTLRLLLTMSAGFPTDDPWADRQESLAPDAFADLLRAGPRFSTMPGTAFEYSNLGFAIAGRAIANVAGMPFQRFVVERLLRPLGMRSTCFASSDVPAGHLVPGHHRFGETWEEEPFDLPGEFSAIGGLYSSVRDLAVWVSGFVDALSDSPAMEHPLRLSSRREMQQMQRLSDVGVNEVGGVAHAFAKGYCLGLTRERHTHWGDVVAHSGGYPGYGSNMRWHPASGIGVIALANGRYATPSDVTSTMLSSLLTERVTLVAPPVPWPELTAMRAAVGQLLTTWDDQLADNVFSMNMDLDERRDRRRAEIERLVATIGSFDPAAASDIHHPSPAEVDWTVTGTTGSLRIELGMSPEPQPRIQTLNIARVEEA